jgi:ribonucleoside-diphosphate reductase beta chain
MTPDAAREGIDEDANSFRYYRNAVSRHWDPVDVDLTTDIDRVADLNAAAFDSLRRTLALFGAGEEAVTEDLPPLAVVLEDVNDQLFLTTQLYEEAKHAEFFHRYWTRVVHAAEDRRGLERSNPRDGSWFNDSYEELFERNEAAMTHLLTDDSPENRVRAYCHTTSRSRGSSRRLDTTACRRRSVATRQGCRGSRGSSRGSRGPGATRGAASGSGCGS